MEGIGAGDYGPSSKRVLSISLRKYTTVFQAKMYANLTSAYEICMGIRPVSICSESQVFLKTLEAVKTTSPLVQQCQKMLNNMSSQQPVGLFWGSQTF